MRAYNPTQVKSQESLKPSANSGNMFTGKKGFFVGIASIIILFLILNYVNILPLFHLVPSLPYITNISVKLKPPTPVISSQPSNNLESCDIKKANNSLVAQVNQLPNVTVGTFIGNITSIKPNNNQTTSLSLTSLDGKQSHIFKLKQDIPVYDKTTRQNLQFSDLKVGERVVLQFNCNLAKGNIFTLTDIGIIRS